MLPGKAQHPLSTLGVMSAGKNWAVYSILRVLFFLAPFGLILWLTLSMGLMPVIAGSIAALLAAAIGLALSVLFLNKQRSEASASIVAWQQKKRTVDDIVEDEAAERLDHPEAAEAGPAGSADAPAADRA